MEPNTPPVEVLDAPPRNGHGANRLPDDARRCTRIREDGSRCWGWSTKASRDEGAGLCPGHLGIGLASSREAAQAAAEKGNATRRHALVLRRTLAPAGVLSPRGALRLRLSQDAVRVADRIAGTILDPDTPALAASRLALDAIEQVDPGIEASVSVSVPDTLEGVEQLTPSALLALASNLGIEPDPLPTP
jgi:hypothetical protein